MLRNYAVRSHTEDFATPRFSSIHDGRPRRPVTPEPTASKDYDTTISSSAPYWREANAEASIGLFIKANGTFFRNLPPEIRTRILTFAFGKRTLHMDLIYGHPVDPGTKEHHHAGLKQLP
jgi:hypothetical protein